MRRTPRVSQLTRLRDCYRARAKHDSKEEKVLRSRIFVLSQKYREMRPFSQKSGKGAESGSFAKNRISGRNGKKAETAPKPRFWQNSAFLPEKRKKPVLSLCGPVTPDMPAQPGLLSNAPPLHPRSTVRQPKSIDRLTFEKTRKLAIFAIFPKSAQCDACGCSRSRSAAHIFYIFPKDPLHSVPVWCSI